MRASPTSRAAGMRASGIGRGRSTAGGRRSRSSKASSHPSGQPRKTSSRSRRSWMPWVACSGRRIRTRPRPTRGRSKFERHSSKRPRLHPRSNGGSRGAWMPLRAITSIGRSLARHSRSGAASTSFLRASPPVLQPPRPIGGTSPCLTSCSAQPSTRRETSQARGRSTKRPLRSTRARVAENSKSSEARMDLSFSVGSLGSLAVDSGDLPLGRALYTRALALRQEVASSDPANAWARRAVARAHERLADIERRLGHPKAAEAHRLKARPPAG